MSNEIRVFRLITNQEIMGEVVESKTATTKIKNPVNLHAQFNENGDMDLKTSPVLLLSDETELTLNNSIVQFSYTPVEEIQKQYKALFSKIIKPATQGIVTSKQLITG